jgi:hypothetical protein
MAKLRSGPAPATVSDYVQGLTPELAAPVNALRETILGADGRIGEQIKWNSPSFYYTGPLPAFDPKEYRRDIVVLNLHRGYPLLVFPSGAKVDDPTGLLEGNYPDGRRLVTIRDVTAAHAAADGLRQVIRQWLALVEQA